MRDMLPRRAKSRVGDTHQHAKSRRTADFRVIILFLRGKDIEYCVLFIFSVQPVKNFLTYKSRNFALSEFEANIKNTFSVQFQ